MLRIGVNFPGRRGFDNLSVVQHENVIRNVLHHREIVDTVRAYMGRFMAYSNVWRQDFTTPFMQIKAPMLLMCATDDVLWPFFERAKTLRADADSAVLKGANFEPDLDPDGLVAAYRAFLAKHRL